MEEKVVNWMKIERNLSHKVSMNEILEKAK